MLLFFLAAILSAPQKPAPVPTAPRQIAGSISDADYPVEAIRAHQQGTTRVRLFVNASGSVESCVIAESSGSPALDKASCTLITERFRYEPARDASGNAIMGKIERRIIWRLPQDGPVLDMAVPRVAFASGELRLFMAQDSVGRRCAVVASGEAFAAVAPFVCPQGLKVEAAELLADPAAILSVIRFTPEGASDTRSPVRGTLLGRAAADYEFDASGSVTGCRDVAVSGPAAPNSPCSAPAPVTGAIAPTATPGVRRARVSYEFYRMGAPET